MAASRVFPFVAFVSFTGALAGLLFGMDTGAISGALPLIAEVFSLNEQLQGLVTSVLMLGAAVGAVAAASLSVRFGRKLSLLFAAALFVVGALMCGLAASVAMIVVGRLILGLAIGVASFTAPLYLSEVAPQRYRGAIISLYQLMITIGIFMAFLLDTALAYEGLWGWMLGAPAIPAALLFVAVIFLPRSPRWLAMRGRSEEARRILGKLREQPRDAERELGEIQNSLRVKQEGWALFRTNANFRRSVGLGVLLQLMQQLTGINVVLYYAPKIFGLAGFETHVDQMWMTVAVGLTNVIVTLFAIGLVDRWGRRPILLLGFLTMAIGMGALTVGLSVAEPTALTKYLCVGMVLVFVTGFALSAGPIVWVLCSEIQPLKGRDFGIMCSTATNWLANMLIAFAFLPLLQDYGGSAVFLAIAILNVSFIFVTLRLVPETKGVSLEGIEKNLMDGKPLREIGRPLGDRSR